MDKRNNQLIEQLINSSEYTERWFKINLEDFIKQIPWDLAKVLKNDADIYNYVLNWYKDNDNDIMKEYVQKNGATIKLRIKEIFGWDKMLWRLVEKLVSGEPESIWVSDTWFLYENRWWHEYWNIENDESYKKIYNEWVRLFEYNGEDIQSLLPEGTVLVDIWCCEWDKAEALLHWIWKKITYLPVDVDKKYIWKSSWKIKELLNDNITVEDWIENHWKITDPIESINSDWSRNYTYFFTWGSIWNYSDCDIDQLLWTTFKPKQWNLVLDYYKAPKTFGEIRDILKAYDNEATKNWFINWLNNLWFYPWYYYPGRNDLWKVADELYGDYHIPKQWFWYNPVNIDDFLKFSVRYEFEDENKNKYYAELDESGNMILNCNNWEIKYWISFNNDWTKYNMFRYNWKDWDRIKDDKDFPKFKLLKWKIIEWFKAIKSANRIWYIPDYVSRIYGNPENIEQLEENDNFPGFEIVHQHLKSSVNEEVYLQKMLCQFWFKWKDGEFIPANFKEWEFYPIEISRRFSDEEMEAILKKNGRNIVKKFDKIGDNEDSKYLNVIVATTS